MKRHVVIANMPLPSQPPPAFEELPPHDSADGVRVLPPDGRFTIDGEWWTVRGCKAVGLGPDRRPAAFVDRTAATIDIFAPMTAAPDCTISVGFAKASIIEEADEPPIVFTGLGVAKGGTA